MSPDQLKYFSVILEVPASDPNRFTQSVDHFSVDDNATVVGIH